MTLPVVNAVEVLASCSEQITECVVDIFML